MGRLCADPGEKHEPRVAISSSAENQNLQFVAYQSVTTGALATAESSVRLLTKAAIEKQTLRVIGLIPGWRRVTLAATKLFRPRKLSASQVASSNVSTILRRNLICGSISLGQAV
jgi:hypothetical protein